jgi:predicted cupin superfamily sugar epimerase
VKEGGNWCLVGCTVSPGFDFEDFELAERDQLVAAYPECANIITRLTRS